MRYTFLTKSRFLYPSGKPMIPHRTSSQHKAAHRSLQKAALLIDEVNGMGGEYARISNSSLRQLLFVLGFALIAEKKRGQMAT